jgi:hypothetical protein
MKKTLLILWFFVSGIHLTFAQDAYWQQHVDYTMNVDMNVKKHTYKATQKAVYTNHSPDTLYNMFYHVYWNVFKPGSSLYWHNKTRKDPDGRIEKLKNLKPDETGEYQIFSLKQNGKPVKFLIEESLLIVELNEPIAPGSTHTFEMEYEVQIPKIIRRSGRENAEGVMYSMAQWYPKIAEYRPDGWHAEPFLGREFFGVWGNFDVKISIDKDFVVAGSGYLQNEKDIWKKDKNGEWQLAPTKKKKRTWHFIAPNVHDFSWAADPDYVRKSNEADGIQLNYYYKKNQNLDKKWGALLKYTPETMKFYNEYIGPYPYKQYSVIQAGDGGMEYAMCTFITGKRSESSLVGVMMHELAHSWFQFVLATDENRYHWLDEGFTTFVSTFAQKIIYENEDTKNPWLDIIGSYWEYATGKNKEPVSIFSDYYLTNESYWMNAYNKGAMFLVHLSNIAGIGNTWEFLRNYYEQWKFKHPGPKDMLRVAEKTTGMELDWFYNQWIESTHYVDFGIESVVQKDGKAVITIADYGSMRVPLDVAVIYDNKKAEIIHIPYFRTFVYRTESNLFNESIYRVAFPWYDGYPNYVLEIEKPKGKIISVFLDPYYYTTDINPDNNKWELKKDKKNKKKNARKKK